MEWESTFMAAKTLKRNRKTKQKAWLIFKVREDYLPIIIPVHCIVTFLLGCLNSSNNGTGLGKIFKSFNCLGLQWICTKTSLQLFLEPFQGTFDLAYYPWTQLRWAFHLKSLYRIMLLFVKRVHLQCDIAIILWI